MKLLKIVSLLFALQFFTAMPSLAQELQERFHDWSLFKAKRGAKGKEKDVCYVISAPIERKGYEDRRGESFFMVTNIENDADEISVASGFFYDSKSDVELSFYAKKFYLFPHKVVAWADDVNDDLEIIKQMQKEEEMNVSSVSLEGLTASDTYSLIGFSPAYRKMKKICKGSESQKVKNSSK